ncbi:MAG: DNA alkylation repair protein [Tannerella sp.]|jgi:3-methyladenine DNA glycosylase AlkD|nr:DNA alkylation repair protein [Tannerella sp.]
MNAEFILNELQSIGTPEKAAHLQRFFKTGPGQYGEGDVFIGVIVPYTRSIAKANLHIPFPEIYKLLTNKYHEARLCALVILAERFKKVSEDKRREIYDFYMKNTPRINNWDLVDLSCPTVVGGYLTDKNRDILYELADSNCLWEQRISIVSTLAFIRKGDFIDTIELSKKLLTHPHDLMHKAVGWMLRETGKRDRNILTGFLEKYAVKMPRTALRYAIEHYPEPERQYFLKKKSSADFPEIN